MTLEHAKQAQQKADAALTTAQAEVAEAKAALMAATLASQTNPPASKEQTEARNAGLLSARGRVTQAEQAQRRAATTAAEARERVARLTPHAAPLAKLDRALAAVVAKDAALTNLGLELYAKVAAEVRDLRSLIVEADATYSSLPVEVRGADLSTPASAAGSWGAMWPDSPGLLRHLDAAVYRRLGRWPSVEDPKGRSRLGSVA